MSIFKFIIFVELLLYLLFGNLLFFPGQMKKNILSKACRPFLTEHSSSMAGGQSITTTEYPEHVPEQLTSTEHTTVTTIKPICDSLTECKADAGFNNCGIICQNVTNVGGIIFSQNFSRDVKNNTCIMRISVCKEGRIKFTLRTFHPQSSEDFLHLYDGSLGEDTLGLVYGNLPAEENFFSTTNVITIVADTDNNEVVIPDGKATQWQAIYEVI